MFLICLLAIADNETPKPMSGKGLTIGLGAQKQSIIMVSCTVDRERRHQIRCTASKVEIRGSARNTGGHSSVTG